MMFGDSDTEAVTIQSTDESFQSWLNKGYVTEATAQRLASVNVLMVPFEGFRDQDTPCFPVGTEELFHFLREHAPEGLVADACIEDENYKELALHFDWMELGKIVATAFVAPFLVRLIADYIVHKRGSQSKSTHVRFSLSINDKGQKKSTNIRYEGPASDFHKTMLDAVNSVSSERDERAERDGDDSTGV